MSVSVSNPRPCKRHRIPGWQSWQSALAGRGFAVQRVADMDGWLAYHAAFVGCIAAALYRCGTDPARLAADRATLRLMCRAITEAFAALSADGTAGLPRNLAVLHRPWLRPVAVRYWARTMRSPAGELCFAAHSRHAEAEMRAQVTTWQPGSPTHPPSPNCSTIDLLLQADRPLPVTRRSGGSGARPRIRTRRRPAGPARCGTEPARWNR